MRLPNTQVQLPGSWRGVPDIETIFLFLLFPNTTVSLGCTKAFWYYTPIIHKDYIYAVEMIATYNKGPSGHFFLTCADVREVGGLPLSGYVSAFDEIIWILIAVSAMATWVVQRNFSTRTDQGSIFMPFSILLDQVCDRPTWYRWIPVVWLIMSIVISNAYRGYNITSLVAPVNLLRKDWKALIS